MSDNNAFLTQTAQTTGVKQLLQEFIMFLAQNRNIVLNEKMTKIVYQSRALSRNPISETFDRMVSSNVSSIFALIYVPSKTIIPEMLEYRHVVFDMLQVKDVNTGLYDVVSRLPEFNNKIILNVTDIVHPVTGVVSDTSKLQTMMVRGLMSRMFYMNQSMSNPWAPMPVISFAAQVFSTVVSNIIAQDFNLSYGEQQIVSMILTYYMLNINIDDIKAISSQMSRRKDYNDSLSLNSVIGMIRSEFEGQLRLQDLQQAMNMIDIPRLKDSIDLRYLYTKIQRLGNDPLIISTALEYPPVWVTMILSALSMTKSGLSIYMKKSHLNAGSDCDQFIKSIQNMNLMKAIV